MEKIGFMLTKYQENILSIMKEDSNNAKEFFRPSNVLWESISNNFEETFNNEGIKEVQSQNFNTLFSLLDNNIFKDHYFKCALWLYYNNLKQKDKFNILNITQPLIPDNLLLSYNPKSINNRPQYFDDKILTWDYLISLDTILSISEYYPEIIGESCVVADLGAGWGRIGYYLSQINPKISYNIFDIPHTLLISQEYIQNNPLKYVNIYNYLSNKSIPLFNKKYLLSHPGIRFHGTQDLEKFDLKSIDIFINVASFQEMNLNQISNYFEIIDNISNYLYSQQRYSDLEMNYSAYPYKSNWEQLYIKDVTFLPLWFETMFKL